MAWTVPRLVAAVPLQLAAHMGARRINDMKRSRLVLIRRPPVSR